MTRDFVFLTRDSNRALAQATRLLLDAETRTCDRFRFDDDSIMKNSPSFQWDGVWQGRVGQAAACLQVLTDVKRNLFVCLFRRRIPYVSCETSGVYRTLSESLQSFCLY